MENHNTDTDFKYTYSTKEQEEIKRIRQKYQCEEEDGMSKLRKLDDSTTSKATVTALALGIVGILFLGTGMSLIMTDLATVLGMTGITNVIVGIAVGMIGIILVVSAYPVYSNVLVREREKIAPEVLRLTSELMK